MTKRKIVSRTAKAFLFSGRPDPQWKLSAAQMKEWEQQWQAAPFSDNKVERPSVLGYTGCFLQDEEHSYWIIYNGCVSFYENDKVTNKKDENRKMEQWLIGTSTAEVKEQVQI